MAKSDTAFEGQSTSNTFPFILLLFFITQTQSARAKRWSLLLLRRTKADVSYFPRDDASCGVNDRLCGRHSQPQHHQKVCSSLSFPRALFSFFLWPFLFFPVLCFQLQYFLCMLLFLLFSLDLLWFLLLLFYVRGCWSPSSRESSDSPPIRRSNA